MAACGACCNNSTGGEVIAVQGPDSTPPKESVAATQKDGAEAPDGGQGNAGAGAGPSPEEHAQQLVLQAVERADSNAKGKRPGFISCQELFDVEIEVRGKRLGIDINYHDGATLLITKLGEGPVMDYNRAQPDQPCLVGDRFICINGQKDDVKLLLDAVKKEDILVGQMRRAIERTIQLVKVDDQEHGVITAPYDLLVLILASDAAEGTLLQLHNETEPEFAMKLDDFIVKVNNVFCNPEAMAQELDKGTQWEITFRRIERKKSG